MKSKYRGLKSRLGVKLRAFKTKKRGPPPPPEPQVPLRRTFTFSWHSIREIQLKLPCSLVQKYKVPLEDIAKRTKYFPVFDRHEGEIYDPDVNLFTARFVRDANTEEWRAQLQAKIDAKEAAERAVIEAKRQAARQALLDKKNLIAKAKLIANPPPPRGPPPKASLEAYHAKVQKEKIEARKKREEDYVAEVKAAEKPFDQFDGPKRPKTYIRRRNSICAPDTGLYNRIKEIKPALQVKSFANRSYSLPDILERYRPAEKPKWAYMEGIADSLSEFHRRYQSLLEFLDNDTYGEEYWAHVSAYQKKMRLRKVLAMGWCTPAFPHEILKKNAPEDRDDPAKSLYVEKDDDVPGGDAFFGVSRINSYVRERRHSIGEPERLQRQFAISHSIRKGYQRLRGRLRRRENMPVRRRSFDMNEHKEKTNGIAENLHLDYDETAKPLTAYGFRRDAEVIERKLKSFSHWTPEHLEEEDMIAKEKYLSRDYEIEDINYVSSNPLVARTDDVQLNLERYKAQEWSGTVGDAVVWQEHFSDEGHQYYYCVSTGESSWEYPQDPHDQVMQQFQDESSGAWYWFNSVTGESEWM